MLYFYIYIYFELFLLFSFISATGDRQEETEVMETDVFEEKCLPSEATTGKSYSDMSELPVRITAKMFHIIPWITAF